MSAYRKPWRHTLTLLPPNGATVWLRLEPFNCPAVTATWNTATGCFTFAAPIQNSGTPPATISADVAWWLTHSWRAL
jgi:hypothetical protein